MIHLVGLGVEYALLDAKTNAYSTIRCERILVGQPERAICNQPVGSQQCAMVVGDPRNCPKCLAAWGEHRGRFQSYMGVVS